MDCYMEVEFTKADAEHLNHGTMPTYDKNRAEKDIARYEKLFGRKCPEDVKERIRKSYRYVGD